ncbi:MAG TPA: LysM peptidoglycan-binding domain-containing protein [Spirochaetota bacterium]|nr:LysM peptidoglycan-binding domain-containing protein [Spirochaetota bacterium]
MATYYKKIKGKNYDKKLIVAADSAVKGRGDGRISLNDAKKILRTVQDASNYSDIEKSTMKYIRDHYAFTPEADRWFRGEIRKWAASRGAADRMVKKPARKISKPKKTASRDAAPRDESRPAPSLPASQRPEAQVTKEAPGLFKRIIKFLLVIIIIAFMFILLIPSARECMKNRIFGLIGSTDQQHKAPEIIKPAEEQKEDAAPVPATSADKPEAAKGPETGGEYYTVQVKDDLISISEKVLGGYSRWIDLYNANRDVIKNPTMIFPGQKLKLPDVKK